MRDASASVRPEVEVSPYADAPINVVIVEGDPLRREGLRTALHREPGFRVAGCGADASVVAVLTHLVGPTVLLLNATLPDDESLHICAHVRVRFPAVRVVVTGMAPPHDELVAFLHVGVAGFIMKEARFVRFWLRFGVSRRESRRFRVP